MVSEFVFDAKPLRTLPRLSETSYLAVSFDCFNALNDGLVAVRDAEKTLGGKLYARVFDLGSGVIHQCDIQSKEGVSFVAVKVAEVLRGA